MYSTKIAYLLWFASFFGAAGLHRLYLGKIGTGVLYFFTGGLFLIGTIYDGITLQDQVREARLKARMRRAIDDRLDELDDLGFRGDRRPARPEGRTGETPEHSILRVARENHGIASAAQVALESGLSTDAAREQLDALVNKGIAEVRVRTSGTLAYVFPDFLDDTGAADLERF